MQILNPYRYVVEMRTQRLINTTTTVVRLLRLSEEQSLKQISFFLEQFIASGLSNT